MTLKNETKGFSMVELIVVMSIAGILSAIAIPNYLAWRSNAQLNSATRSLYASIQKAKLQAIKRNRNVGVSFTVATCGTLPPASLPAAVGGYTVFLDDGSGGGTAKDSIQNGSEETLLNGVLSPAVALCNASFSSKQGVSFKPEGLPVSPGHIDIANTQRSQTITVTNAGVVRLQ